MVPRLGLVPRGPSLRRDYCGRKKSAPALERSIGTGILAVMPVGHGILALLLAVAAPGVTVPATAGAGALRDVRLDAHPPRIG